MVTMATMVSTSSTSSMVSTRSIGGRRTRARGSNGRTVGPRPGRRARAAVVVVAAARGGGGGGARVGGARAGAVRRRARGGVSTSTARGVWGTTGTRDGARRAKATPAAVEGREGEEGRSGDDANARVQKNDAFERLVRFVAVRARAAWIALVVAVVAAAAKPPSAAAANANAETPRTATVSSGIVHNIHELKTYVRTASTDAMRTTLRTVGRAIETVEAKTQEDWHIEDAWVLFAWNWLTRHGRRKAFDAIESAKNKMNPSRAPRAFERSILHWLIGPMQVFQGLFILGYSFDVGCDMIDQLSTEWDIPEYIKLGWDKGSYTFAMGILGVMSIQHFGPRLLRNVFPSLCQDASVQLVITRLTSAVVVIATLMATLAAFGIPAQVLFSFGGLGGLAFGLAAKDFISNLIGGLVLAVMRPFKVGEKIFLTGGGGKYRDSKEKNVSDYKVEEIGWYQTRLIPKDGKVTTIPNGYFLGANVINSSREPNEWVGPAIRVAIPDYEGVEAMTNEIREYLNACPDVNSSYKRPECWLKKIEPDHLLVQIDMFMHGDTHYGEKRFKLKRQELLVNLIRIVKKHCPNSPAVPIEIDGYGAA